MSSREFNDSEEVKELRRVLLQRQEQETAAASALIQNSQRRLELTSALGRYQMERAQSELRELHLRQALNTAQERMDTAVSVKDASASSLRVAMLLPANVAFDAKFCKQRTLEVADEGVETRREILRQLAVDLATETRAQTLAAERIADVERALALVSEARPELEAANQAAREAKKLQQKLVQAALERQAKRQNKKVSEE